MRCVCKSVNVTRHNNDMPQRGKFDRGIRFSIVNGAASGPFYRCSDCGREFIVRDNKKKIIKRKERE